MLQIPKQLSIKDKEDKDKKDQRDKRRREQQNIEEEEDNKVKDVDLDKVDQEVNDITEKYFEKKLDEDDLRIKLNNQVIDSIEKNLDAACQEADNVQSFHIVDRFKKDVTEYINFVRSDKFREESLSYAKTSDNMRVDFGLVISRPPIFLRYFAIYVVFMMKICNLVNIEENFLRNITSMLIKYTKNLN